jgi:hypothetical protein
MQFGNVRLFNGGPQLKPKSRRTLTPADADAELAQRQSAAVATASFAACQLVHRNYFWLVLDGPGIIVHEYNYDDFFYPTPPNFDFPDIVFDGLECNLCRWARTACALSADSRVDQLR